MHAPQAGSPSRRRGFTLAELLVSVAIMSLLLITVGAIFAMTTKATGLANANNEVMNNLRAFEQQIRRDLQGIRKDAFLGLCYNYLQPRDVAPGRLEQAAVRSDGMVFFANGDFQTIAQGWDRSTNPPTFHGANVVPIKSNLARVEYGMLGVLENGVTGNANAARPLSQIELGRYAKLMVSPPLVVTGGTPVDPPAYGTFAAAGFRDTTNDLWDKTTDVYENWEYEYVTLADWRNPTVSVWPATSYATNLIGHYSGSVARNNLWLGLPYIDVAQTLSDHLRMIPGCLSFKVQRWAETDPVNPVNAWVPRWWPEDNDSALPTPVPPAGFGPPSPIPTSWAGLRIWECFNAPPIPLNGLNQPGFNDWPQPMGDTTSDWPWVVRDVDRDPAATSPPDLRRAVKAAFPKALKITITVLDANRRMLEKVPATNNTYGDGQLSRLGAQTFSMIIPLD